MYIFVSKTTINFNIDLLPGSAVTLDTWCSGKLSLEIKIHAYGKKR